MDVFSRKVVGWMLSDAESAKSAAKLFRVTCKREMIEANQLTVHSDRGSSMKSAKLGRLYQSLKIARSLSRPYVSNDNPFSESFFKTLKYGTSYPKRFSCFEEALDLCRREIDSYNCEHYHSGLALMTPELVHSGKAGIRNTERQKVMDRAFKEHPERFVRGNPSVLPLPVTVYINKPLTAKPSVEPPGAQEVQPAKR
jgi:putative transposase